MCYYAYCPAPSLQVAWKVRLGCVCPCVTVYVSLSVSRCPCMYECRMCGYTHTDTHACTHARTRVRANTHTTTTTTHNLCNRWASWTYSWHVTTRSLYSGLPYPTCIPMSLPFQRATFAVALSLTGVMKESKEWEWEWGKKSFCSLILILILIFI